MSRARCSRLSGFALHCVISVILSSVVPGGSGRPWRGIRHVRGGDVGFRVRLSTMLDMSCDGCECGSLWLDHVRILATVVKVQERRY